MAGIIPPAVLDQIRHASDIVDIIGGYFPLRKAGANFLALCPFHRERTPSFNVNPHRQIFHCFGCQKGGDVFTFVQEYENISFVEAVRRLAQRANIPIETEQTEGQREFRHLKESLWQIHEQITQRWQNALNNEAAGQPARDYLERRHVSAEAIKLFRLGFAPEVWDDTVNWAKSRDYPLPLIEQAGLIIRKETSDHFYDRFRGRLIFPICDDQGRVIGFSGRLLDAEAKAAKYVNSPETPIFTKGKVFFGLDKSKRALLDEETAIICEGQLDLIACFTGGVQNVVAPQGTALTADHARILKRYVSEVVLCFDSDTAGKNAALRSFDHLLTAGLAVRVASLPAPHDPDSFIKEHGADAFRQLTAKAPGFFDYYLDQLCSLHDPTTDKGRIAITTEMAQAVGKSGSAVLMDTYAQKTALRLAVSPEAARAQFKRTKPAPAYENEPLSNVPPEMADQATEAPPSVAETWLVKLLLRDDAPVDWVLAHLDLQWLQHPLVRRIVQGRLARQTDQTWQGLPSFLQTLDDDHLRRMITAGAAEQRPVENVERNLQEIVLRLRNQFVDRELAAAKLQVVSTSLAEGELEELLHRQALLRRIKLEPLRPLAPDH